MTDTERMNWLVQHCYYLEHNKEDPNGFWPHQAEPGMYFNSDYVELTLRDYIDQRIKETAK